MRLLTEGRDAVKPMDYELTEFSLAPVPHLTFAKYITLTGLPAGDYTAIVEATDSVARKLVKQQAAFVITK